MADSVRLPLAEDTPLEIEAIQIAIWRQMSPERKAGLIVGICAALDDLVVEGVKRRHPGSSPRQQFLRRAIVRLGYDQAVEAFPDAAGLIP